MTNEQFKEIKELLGEIESNTSKTVDEKLDKLIKEVQEVRIAIESLDINISKRN